MAEEKKNDIEVFIDGEKVGSWTTIPAVTHYGSVKLDRTAGGPLLDEETKRGARNSRRDAERLQQIHDYAKENGAICSADGKSLGPDDELVYFGEPVKAVKLNDGSVKFGGYLVRFGDEDNTDLTKDFFTKSTDLGEAQESDVYFNHRLPVVVEDVSVEYKKKLSRAKLTRDDVGVFAETILKARNEYEQAIIDAGLAGKLGWSSGTAGHLVDREPVGKAWKITKWDLGLDASLTPTPAEPRNHAQTLKSWISTDAERSAAEAISPNEGETKQAAQPAKENIKMEANEFKALFDEQTKTIEKLIDTKVEAAAEKAVEKALDALPEVKANMNGNVKVTLDEADRPFQSHGEFFMSVKNAAIAPHALDPRLKKLHTPAAELKATGYNEAIPSEGGFLVQNETAAGIKEKMYKTGTVLSQFAKDPVTGNTMTYNKVDETSRADGSRNGGVTGYWGSEAGSLTASKGKFNQLELKLKKVYALCVATDEVLEDAGTLGSWLMRVAPEELRFKVEDAIINGNGVGKPLGILNSGALKSATRTDANEIDVLDIGRMWAARYSGADDYVWFGNQSIFPQLLTLTIGNMPVFLPAGGLSGLPYATLLGRPYYDTEYNPTLGTLGDLLLCSPSGYQAIEKSGGIQTASSIHVYFTQGEQAFRFVYRVDGGPLWDTTLTGKDGGTYSPFVVLAATT